MTALDYQELFASHHSFKLIEETFFCLGWLGCRNHTFNFQLKHLGFMVFRVQADAGLNFRHS